MFKLPIIKLSILILERRAFSADETIAPMMAMTPRHFRFELSPIAELRNAANDVHILPSDSGLPYSKVNLAHTVRDVLDKHWVHVMVIAAVVINHIFLVQVRLHIV